MLALRQGEPRLARDCKLCVGFINRTRERCYILLHDLTPLHVKIVWSTNLLSVCRRKLKVIDLMHTVSIY